MLKNNKNLNKLVEYLIAPYSTDAEKARVLLAWIVYYIDYDEYLSDKRWELKYNRKANNVASGDILETRSGICADIAELYANMARMAGLEVEVVSGDVSGCSFEEMKVGVCAHAWNVVKIDNEWEYVDPTWAMGYAKVLGDLTSSTSYNRALAKRSKGGKNLQARRGRSVHEEWFLTDKEEMIKTHFPDDEQWQLQKKKITQAKFMGMNDRAFATKENRWKRNQERRSETEAR